MNHYPWFRPLRGAIEDALRVREWLVDKERGGAVTQCELILSSKEPPPEKPLNADIDTAIQRIIDAARVDGAAERRFYFYFGGHGFANMHSDVALCMVRWSKVYRGCALSSSKYTSALVNYGLFDEIVFWLDCCRTSEIGGEGQGPWNAPPSASPDARRSRSFLAHATSFLNPAGESAVEGDASVVRGHFTQALLAGLWGGAVKDGRGVSPAGLKEYLQKETPLIAQEAKRSGQIPEVIDGLNGSRLFGTAGIESEVEIVFQKERSGEVVLEDSSLNVLKRGLAATGPWRVSLRRDRYTLRELSTGVQHTFSFRPTREGQRVRF
ncbi:hypothetical protein [Pyxidicoccus xibeiensis]|uniref:hypothetical protein n=1 Tax=Pyxidicoccus xibeiensis TaxID=2906759 RepID=UPI0020A704F4|nr:hypothetical protein [Pyxidicoccus xibeiensis]MCP3135755.1 hypothetical protein [Pyxidicoccus xibeiensis]